MLIETVVVFSLLLLLLFVFIIPLPLLIKIQFSDYVLVKIKILGFIPVSIGKKSGTQNNKNSNKKFIKNRNKKNRQLSLTRLKYLLFKTNFGKKMTKALYLFLKRFFFSIKININKGVVSYGAVDPAKTGLFFGKYYSLLPLLRLIDGTEKFVLCPNFVKKELSGEIDGVVKIYIGRLFLSIILILFNWPLWHTLSLFKKSKT